MASAAGKEHSSLRCSPRSGYCSRAHRWQQPATSDRRTQVPWRITALPASTTVPPTRATPTRVVAALSCKFGRSTLMVRPLAPRARGATYLPLTASRTLSRFAAPRTAMPPYCSACGHDAQSDPKENVLGNGEPESCDRNRERAVGGRKPRDTGCRRWWTRPVRP